MHRAGATLPLAALALLAVGAPATAYGACDLAECPDLPPVCDAVGCPTTEDTDGDGAADEVHHCSGASCEHLDDEDSDGDADTARVSVAMGEHVTLNSNANLTSRTSRTQAYVADAPDAEEYFLVYVLADIDASGDADETRLHEATLYTGLWLVNDAAAQYEELAGLEAHAHDHDDGADDVTVTIRKGIE